MAETGFGQQDPTDTAGDHNERMFVIAQALAKVSTMKVVLVKAIDTDAKTVDVQPMVNQVDGENNATPHGTILGIPYVVWQYGKSAVLADPAVDDIGLMICADRDISSVKATKAVAPPGSFRQLEASDGVYLGGILNGAPEQWVKFTDTGMEWHDVNANNILSGPTGISINGVLFNRTGQVAGDLPVTGALKLAGSIEALSGSTYAGDIHTTGTITSDVDVLAGGISGKHHRHTQSGGGNTGEPIP